MTPQNFPLIPLRRRYSGPPPERDRAPLNVENEVALVCEHHVSLPLFVDDGDHPQCPLGHPAWTRSFASEAGESNLAVLGRQQSGFEHTQRYVTCVVLKEIDRSPRLMVLFIYT